MPQPWTGDADTLRESMVTGSAAAVVDTSEIIFVPGLNNSAAVWSPVISALLPRFPARAVDCPALDDMDGVAAALLDDLPERFVAVGHSFGGYVVLSMLAQQPHRLRGVVLVNSGDNADTPDQAAGRLAKAEEARTGDYEQMAMARVDLVYHPNNRDNEALLDERRAGVREYGVQRYVAHLAACARRPDRGALLTATEVPVLVVASDHDQVIRPAAQRAMAKRAGAAFSLIPNAGHMLPAEEPATLARVIAEWVAVQ
ncbi:MAG: alpha/beta fold hydrolase [Allobranchiibius sp.]